MMRLLQLQPALLLHIVCRRACTGIAAALLCPAAVALACYDVSIKGDLYHVDNREGAELILWMLNQGCDIESTSALLDDQLEVPVWGPCDPDDSTVFPDEDAPWDYIEGETLGNVGTGLGQSPGTIPGGATAQPSGDPWIYTEGDPPGNAGTATSPGSTTVDDAPSMGTPDIEFLDDQPVPAGGAFGDGTPGSSINSPAPSTGTQNIRPLEDQPVPTDGNFIWIL